MYLTAIELQNLYGADELTDVPTEQIDLALAAAEAEVNGVLSTRYLVPFAEGAAPDLIKTIVADLARYRIYGNGRPYNQDLTSDVNSRYKNAWKLLEKLGSGGLVLPGAESVVQTAAKFETPPHPLDNFFNDMKGW